MDPEKWRDPGLRYSVQSSKGTTSRTVVTSPELTPVLIRLIDLDVAH